MQIDEAEEPLNLLHQELLTKRFQQLNLDISEYSFANLFLFRSLHHYTVVKYPEVFLKGYSRDGKEYLMPTFPLYELDQNKLINLLKNVAFFFPIPEEWLPHFDPKLFHFDFVESDSDYVYSIKKISTYAGRDLSKKRNLVKQLLEAHSVTIEKLKKENHQDALSVLSFWQEELSDKTKETDYEPCLEAINNFEQLKLDGRIFYTDGHACGMSLGEKLSQGNYVIHFAKACKHLKGLYQYIYQEIAQELEEDYSQLNLEQDLGEPQIRQSKHSYQPDRMVHKYRLKLC